jgi:flagellar protein FlaG
MTPSNFRTTFGLPLNTLGFAMDDTLNSPVVTVRSTQTGEVIRQIPSEAVIRVAHTLDELKGLLHDAVS